MRWYDALIGRFLTRAPVPPHIEHAYIIVNNNPIFFADPLGKWAGPRPGTEGCDSAHELLREAGRCEEAHAIICAKCNQICNQLPETIADRFWGPWSFMNWCVRYLECKSDLDWAKFLEELGKFLQPNPIIPIPPYRL